MNPSAPVLSVSDLRVEYPTDGDPAAAVRSLGFSLQRGRTLGVVGESGSGKSTVGKALMGLLPAGSEVGGSAVLEDGTDLLQLSADAQRKARGAAIGMVFQEPMTRLDPLMRISAHFIETVRAHNPRMTNAQATAKSLEVLRKVGIPPTRWKQYPHEFSGGMRQRIMIALALVTEPAIVVADEATTALDVLVEAQILRLFRSIQREFDTALVIITHNLGIVAEACDDVAVMYAGRIVEYGGCKQILESPKHPYTQGLLASTISLSTTELYSIPGSPPSLFGRPLGCAFADRCFAARHECSTGQPPTERMAEGHEIECWLPSLNRAESHA